MAEILFVNSAGQFEHVVFDVTIRENYDRAADIPEHPVEDGSVINDHVRTQAPLLSLEVAVSNRPIKAPISEFTGEPIFQAIAESQSVSLSPGDTPLDAMTKAASISGGAGFEPPLPLGLGLDIGGRPYELEPAQWGRDGASVSLSFFRFPVQDRVKAVFDQLDSLWGLSLTVLTSYRQFDSVALARVGAPVESRGFLRFSLEFKPFRLTQTETIDPTDPVKARDRNEIQVGAQAGYELPEQQKSAALGIQDTVRGFFSRKTAEVPQ